MLPVAGLDQGLALRVQGQGLALRVNGQVRSDKPPVLLQLLNAATTTLAATTQCCNDPDTWNYPLLELPH